MKLPIAYKCWLPVFNFESIEFTPYLIIYILTLMLPLIFCPEIVMLFNTNHLLKFLQIIGHIFFLIRV